MAPSRTPTKPFTYCEGVSRWDPATYIADKDLLARAVAHLAKDDLISAVAESFSLPPRDSYVYHAIVSVTLAQVQHVIGLGAANGLHAWYRYPSAPPPEKQQKLGPSDFLPPPPKPDVETYLQIFDPKTATPNILKSLSSNAKKNSLRASIAAHLLGKRYLHPALPQLQIARSKAAPPNPYLDFLTWACLNLEYAGPCPESEAVKSSHHSLPVFMHHFGCVCPSHEALSILKILADGREIWDMGSGNGYWTFMLRQYGLEVKPVDNAQSSWRVTWVKDTTISDGVQYLNKPGNKGGEHAVLLLVYPIVGGGIAGGEEGGFTRQLVKAYKGDTIAVVGTQNHNGYTGFRNMSMDEYMEKEEPDWTKVVQIPLPSFPGKDEALFVFQRGNRAPRRNVQSN
ncbi:hypothetical protein BKA67DRAFT_663443 [Truncatella angustata]|uniref:Uncharacterized protein n=1 Tax=Truncatella angustata TaxID=152316 RepID=A0A9P8RJN9_9PEZI|nr:uncharacterized protein BKA67DRAFT_663443 [Truncatella angustata]KAH6647097.1 hypothetical protein BKA67DRAFT_663443 [Truncatella angustata]KAH8200363.1 hypothetical protein TruAng_005452 [Truncatella angustata]